MARKVVNRRELREANDAAEARERDDDEVEEIDAEAESGEEGEESTGKKKKKAAEKKPAKAAKRKSRSKSAEPARMRLFWGVFNQSLKRIALYDFTQRKQAEAKAAELSASGKSPHFVQKVKEAVSG